MQYLADIEEHLGVIIDQTDSTLKVQADAFDGKVAYGQKKKHMGQFFGSCFQILLIMIDTPLYMAYDIFSNISMYLNNLLPQSSCPEEKVVKLQGITSYWYLFLHLGQVWQTWQIYIHFELL